MHTDNKWNCMFHIACSSFLTWDSPSARLAWRISSFGFSAKDELNMPTRTPKIAKCRATEIITASDLCSPACEFLQNKIAWSQTDYKFEVVFEKGLSSRSPLARRPELLPGAAGAAAHVLLKRLQHAGMLPQSRPANTNTEIAHFKYISRIPKSAPCADSPCADSPLIKFKKLFSISRGTCLKIIYIYI